MAFKKLITLFLTIILLATTALAYSGAATDNWDYNMESVAGFSSFNWHSFYCNEDADCVYWLEPEKYCSNDNDWPGCFNSVRNCVDGHRRCDQYDECSSDDDCSPENGICHYGGTCKENSQNGGNYCDCESSFSATCNGWEEAEGVSASDDPDEFCKEARGHRECVFDEHSTSCKFKKQYNARCVPSPWDCNTEGEYQGKYCEVFSTDGSSQPDSFDDDAYQEALNIDCVEEPSIDVCTTPKAGAPCGDCNHCGSAYQGYYCRADSPNEEPTWRKYDYIYYGCTNANCDDLGASQYCGNLEWKCEEVPASVEGETCKEWVSQSDECTPERMRNCQPKNCPEAADLNTVTGPDNKEYVCAYTNYNGLGAKWYYADEIPPICDREEHVGSEIGYWDSSSSSWRYKTCSKVPKKVGVNTYEDFYCWVYYVGGEFTTENCVHEGQSDKAGMWSEFVCEDDPGCNATTEKTVQCDGKDLLVCNDVMNNDDGTKCFQWVPAKENKYDCGAASIGGIDNADIRGQKNCNGKEYSCFSFGLSTPFTNLYNWVDDETIYEKAKSCGSGYKKQNNGLYSYFDENGDKKYFYFDMLGNWIDVASSSDEIPNSCSSVDSSSICTTIGETRWVGDTFQVCKETSRSGSSTMKKVWTDVDNSIVDCSQAENCVESNGEEEYRCVKLGTDDHPRWYKTSYLKNSANLAGCLDYTYFGVVCQDTFGHRNVSNTGWIENEYSKDDVDCFDEESYTTAISKGDYCDESFCEAISTDEGELYCRDHQWVSTAERPCNSGSEWGISSCGDRSWTCCQDKDSGNLYWHRDDDVSEQCVSKPENLDPSSCNPTAGAECDATKCGCGSVNGYYCRSDTPNDNYNKDKWVLPPYRVCDDTHDAELGKFMYCGDKEWECQKHGDTQWWTPTWEEDDQGTGDNGGDSGTTTDVVACDTKADCGSDEWCYTGTIISQSTNTCIPNNKCANSADSNSIQANVGTETCAGGNVWVCQGSTGTSDEGWSLSKECPNGCQDGVCTEDETGGETNCENECVLGNTICDGEQNYFVYECVVNSTTNCKEFQEIPKPEHQICDDTNLAKYVCSNIYTRDWCTESSELGNTKCSDETSQAMGTFPELSTCKQDDDGCFYVSISSCIGSNSCDGDKCSS